MTREIETHVAGLKAGDVLIIEWTYDDDEIELVLIPANVHDLR